MRNIYLALLITLPVSAAHADDKLACQEIDIGSTGEFREQHLVDTDMSGAKSAGDRLVGQRFSIGFLPVSPEIAMPFARREMAKRFVLPT